MRGERICAARLAAGSIIAGSVPMNGADVTINPIPLDVRRNVSMVNAVSVVMKRKTLPATMSVRRPIRANSQPTRMYPIQRAKMAVADGALSYLASR